jgi:hypothetical protein
MGELERLSKLVEGTEKRKKELEANLRDDKIYDVVKVVSESALRGASEGEKNKKAIGELNEKSKIDKKFNFLWLFSGGVVVSVVNILGVIFNFSLMAAIAGGVVNLFLLGLFLSGNRK